MKKVMVLLADGFEEIEAIAVPDVLRRAGVHCDLVSIKEREVRGANNIVVLADELLSKINPEEYDCVVLPGGLPGAHNLRDDERVKNIVLDFNEKGKIVAAICASPGTLEDYGILKGKKCTSYPSFIKNTTNKKYIDDVVVVDGNIITSRGPATSLEFGYSILEQLGHENKANELREGMQVNLLYKVKCK